jgi:hypothetical protein
MKTIQQLQKVAKRLPRLKRKFEQIIDKGRRGGHVLTDDALGQYLVRIQACEQGLRLLAIELLNRRIGQPPFRDATPPEVKRRQALRALATLAGGAS